MDFEYVVNHADQPPLAIDLLFPSQAEPPEPYTAGDISKDGFDGAQSLAIDVPAPGTVYFVFHLFYQAGLLMFPGIAEFDGELARGFLVFRPEAAFSEMAVPAVSLIALEFHE